MDVSTYTLSFWQGQLARIGFWHCQPLCSLDGFSVKIREENRLIIVLLLPVGYFAVLTGTITGRVTLYLIRLNLRSFLWGLFA